MTIIEKLADLGFANAELLGEEKGTSRVRIRTSKGWIYDRFSSEEAVDRWANFHKPETEE
jgi:hypothetical protein